MWRTDFDSHSERSSQRLLMFHIGAFSIVAPSDACAGLPLAGTSDTHSQMDWIKSIHPSFYHPSPPPNILALQLRRRQRGNQLLPSSVRGQRSRLGVVYLYSLVAARKYFYCLL